MNISKPQKMATVIHPDNRGTFSELHREGGKLGTLHFVQTNLIHSVKGALRGMHYRIDGTQAKLITVLSGEIYDVAINCKQNDPNLGRWEYALLKAGEQFLVPAGYAHGFLSLEESVVLYSSTTVFDAEKERSLRWDDPDVNVHWPVVDKLIMSDKDIKGGTLHESIIC